MEGHGGILPIKEEAFWASIVAKWSDACSNIVLLKTELEKAHSESRQQQECVNALRAREEVLIGERDQLAREFEEYRELTAAHTRAKEDIIRHVSTQTVASQVHDEALRTKLRQAEEGLVQAENEYLRMKDQSDEQLQHKDEELQRKNKEIATLALLKDKLQKANLTLVDEKTSLEIEFTSNKAIWEKHVAELSSILDKDEEGKSVRLGQNADLIVYDNRDCADVKLDQKLPYLSQEVKSLKASVATHKRENAALRERLSYTQQQLQGANEIRQLLLDKNKTLPENLARSNGLKLRELELTASRTSQRDLTLASTPTKGQPASTEPNNLESGRTTIKQTGSCSSVSSPPSRTHRTPTMNKTTSSQPVWRFVSADFSPTPMPKAREQALAQLNDYIPVDDSDVRFRRALLVSAIGGNIQSLIVRVTQSQTALAKTHDISMYLCPALELNPWCPTIPGKHGYMFVGLGQEKHTFGQPHVGLNVFLGKTLSHGKPKEYCYLGVYNAVRVNGLSVDEWNLLSDEFKISYSNTTKEKNKDPRTAEAIRTAYDAGELSVPCVRLQCTHFNEALYNALAAAHLVPSPRPLRTAEKRKRDDGDHPARPNRLTPESDAMVVPNDALCSNSHLQTNTATQ